MREASVITRLKNWISNNLVFWGNKINKHYRKLYSNQHQLTSTTSSDRYPELFNEAVREYGAATPAKILSFGCSTGEECFSLKKYFPLARIVGVDINKQNLKTASRNNNSAEIKFVYSSTENIQLEGKYDLIFCLSVLCRWEDTKHLTNCEETYPFTKYEETVSMLADQLLPKGLLVIYNSNFRFEDTKHFQHFEIVSTPSVTDSGFVNKFDSHNEAITGLHRTCIYRKKS